jgi:hypothetical protein
VSLASTPIVPARQTPPRSDRRPAQARRSATERTPATAAHTGDRAPRNGAGSPATRTIPAAIMCRGSSAEPPERLKLSSSSAIRGADAWMRSCQRGCEKEGLAARALKQPCKGSKDSRPASRSARLLVGERSSVADIALYAYGGCRPCAISPTTSKTLRRTRATPGPEPAARSTTEPPHIPSQRPAPSTSPRKAGSRS